ncbi:hypothetical protein IJ531_03765 [bacterium]|nr:hypothetical protein [bacterium]
MQVFNFQNDKDKELKIKEYINNYLLELQRHFDMSDKRMRLILYKVYREKGVLYLIKNFIKKRISMVKSFYKNKLKRFKIWK